MKIAAILPARMGSSRFPGKPLAPLLGRPMIEHVYRRTALCERLSEVVVATCDEEIRAAVEGFGGRAVMTSAEHQRASDRVAEAARVVDADVIVMVQGDEPMVTPGSIEQAIGPFADAGAGVECVNLVARIGSRDEHRDPNTIKVVMDAAGDALYFSREAIPTERVEGFDTIPVFKQVCIIPFTRRRLERFAALSPTALERAESVDMMRFLEHGLPVRLVETDLVSHAVDTPADLKRVEGLLRTDPLTRAAFGDALELAAG